MRNGSKPLESNLPADDIRTVLKLKTGGHTLIVGIGRRYIFGNYLVHMDGWSYRGNRELMKEIIALSGTKKAGYLKYLRLFVRNKRSFRMKRILSLPVFYPFLNKDDDRSRPAYRWFFYFCFLTFLHKSIRELIF